MENYRETLRILNECAELIAAAIIKKTHPCKDDISENEAKKRYGSKWLKRRREMGLIERNYIGNRIIYSIHELECVKAAEKEYEVDFERIYRHKGGE